MADETVVRITINFTMHEYDYMQNIDHLTDMLRRITHSFSIDAPERPISIDVEH